MLKTLYSDRKSFIIPILVFALALLIRLYNLEVFANFTADEEYQSTYANTLVEDLHPIWIGVSAADTGFYLGPYFTYLTAFLIWLVQDPLIFNIASSVMGATTVVLLYFLGKEISSRKVGLISSLIYSFSPYLIYYDQRYWNPSPLPLICSLFALSLIKLPQSKWWLVIAFACLGSIWHIHLSLVPLYLVVIGVHFLEKKLYDKRSLLVSIFILFIFLLPLIIFDYYHAWSNLTTPLRMLEKSENGLQFHLHTYLSALPKIYFLTSGNPVLGEIIKPCADLARTIINPVVGLLYLLPLSIFLWQKRKSRNIKILAIIVVLLSLSFIFYPGPIAEYYLLGLFPILILVGTLAFSLFVRPYIFQIILLLLFISFSIFTLVERPAGFGLSAKKELIKDSIRAVGDAPFHLQEEGTCLKYGGWRYLFSVWGKTPRSSSTDQSLGWLYPNDIGNNAAVLVQVGKIGELQAPDGALNLYSGAYQAAISKYYEID